MSQGIDPQNGTTSFFVPTDATKTQTQGEIICFELKAQDEAHASAHVAKLKVQFEEKYGKDSPLKAQQGEDDKSKIIIEYHPREGDTVAEKSKVTEFFKNSTVGQQTPELIVACVLCTLPPDVQQQKIEEARARWRAVSAGQHTQRILAFRTRPPAPPGKSAGR